MPNLTDKIYVGSQADYDKERRDALKKLGWKPGHDSESGYCDDEVDHSPQTVVDHKKD